MSPSLNHVVLVACTATRPKAIIAPSHLRSPNTGAPAWDLASDAPDGAQVYRTKTLTNPKLNKQAAL